MNRNAILTEIGELYRVQGPQNPREFATDATIVLVGCRGSGKRSLGFIGAMHLGRRLITEDHYFEEVTGLSRKSFLSRYGNQEFRRKNVQVLQKMLKDNSSNCIIECGMGSLAKEAQTTLREYSRSHPVIHIIRNFDRIRRLLGLSEDEARRLEYADSVHGSCSNFEYYNLHDPSCEINGAENSHDRANPNYSFGLKDAKKDFSGFLDFISGHGAGNAALESPFSIAAVPAEKRQYTFALSLSLSNLLRTRIDLSELESGGGDVVELKVDTWTSNMLSVLAKQVAVIRREIGVPVILSIKEFVNPAASESYATTPEDSKASIPCTQEVAVILLEQGLRLGVEYISIELSYEQHNIQRLLRERGRTKTIGHYHEAGLHTSGWLDLKWLALYERAQSFGFDIVRLIQAASSWKDNEDIKIFGEQIAAVPAPHPPLIAYNSGNGGTPSLVSNKIFSPVTHPALRRQIDIPSYLPTAEEALRSLFLTSIFDPLHFYITGAMVSYSLSPAMHDAAYKVCGMQHTYRIHQTSSIDDLLRLTQDPAFGGSAINQPFRIQILPHLATLSSHARAIGAVNTIVPLRAVPDQTPQFLVNQAAERKCSGPTMGLYGDNTDWIGIMTSIRRNSSPRNAVQPSRTTGLVIGAGGMARSAIYALIRLGCRKIFIYNRTITNAEAVASHFNAWAAPLSNHGPVVDVLRSRDEAWPTGMRQPTLVVCCLPAHSVDNNPVPNFEMPGQWLRSPSGGVVMEVRCSSPFFWLMPCADAGKAGVPALRDGAGASDPRAARAHCAGVGHCRLSRGAARAGHRAV
jgi:shikimate 5-dehydrogenase/shikimate kinase/3-dehydroquinate dehydratase